MQLATAADQEPLRRAGVFDMKAQVGVELLVEPGAQLARGRELAFATGERRRVDAEGHPHRRLVDRDPGQRVWGLGVGQRVTDGHFVKTSQENDVAGARARHGDAVQPAIHQHLHHFRAPRPTG